MKDGRRDENYNQKYLNKKDKEFLRGFDWAIEMALDSAFNNLEDMLGEDSYIMHHLNEKLPESVQEDYTMEFSFGRKDEDRTTETYADLIRYKMLEFAEAEKNDLIISMIEGMDDKEYEAIKKDVDEREGKKNDSKGTN